MVGFVVTLKTEILDLAEPSPKRDRSQRTSAARKARQRAKLRAAKLVRLELTIPTWLLDELKAVSAVTNQGVSGEAEFVLLHYFPQHRSQHQALTQRAGNAWRSAQRFLPYAGYLASPGSSFRVGSRVYTHTEWAPLFEELSKLYAFLSKSRGWTRLQCDAYLRQAAKKSKLFNAP